MSAGPASLRTFEASCAHWSEQGREGMEAFYRLATVDYRHLVEAVHWHDVFAALTQRFGARLGLLDVACGSGKFPAALREHAGLERVPGLHVDYALLDPSPFSVREARASLAPPFEAAEEYLCTVQEFEPPAHDFAIAWATHALYCVPRAQAGLAVDRMLAALAPGGLGFIAIAQSSAHYVRFHELHLEDGAGTGDEPYCAAEHVVGALEARGAPFETWSIRYEGTLALDQRDTVERYLQRCLFDDTATLDDMLAARRVGPYLRALMDERAGAWRFPQTVSLIFFGDAASLAAGRRAG